jgi:hypothetical protein
VQIAGARVTVRVAGPGTVEAAPEIRPGQALQLVGQLDGQDAGLGERPCLAGVREDVRVHHVVGHITCTAAELLRTRQGRQSSAPGNLVVAHKPVPVPLGLAVPDAYPVHHPVAGEPVVSDRVLRIYRVRPGAQQTAGQVHRDGSGDLEVVTGDFLVNRGERPLQPVVAELLRRTGLFLCLGHRNSLSMT